MRGEVMSFDVIHVNDLTDHWTLIELSHVIGNVMIWSEEFLVALSKRMRRRERGGGWSDLKIDNIHFIETDQCHEQTDIHCGDFIIGANKSEKEWFGKKIELEENETLNWRGSLRIDQELRTPHELLVRKLVEIGQIQLDKLLTTWSQEWKCLKWNRYWSEDKSTNLFLQL
jgi:hypothetical protein